MDDSGFDITVGAIVHTEYDEKGNVVERFQVAFEESDGDSSPSTENDEYGVEMVD